MVRSPSSYQSQQSHTEYVDAEYVDAPPGGCVDMTGLAAGDNPYSARISAVAPSWPRERSLKKFDIASFNLMLLSSK
jgi:hypothetical protein